MKWIGEKAFQYNNSLSSVSFGNSLESIGYMAFMRCSGLKTLTFPASVKKIASQAFRDCNNLIEIKVLATTPPSAESSIFSGGIYEKCVLKVPSDAVWDYKTAAGWKNFKNIVGF